MNDLADAMPFAKMLGIEILEGKPDKVMGTMTVRPEFCTLGDTIHGGALMSFADSLAAAGAFLSLPQGAKGTITIEAKTNFVGKAARGETITATATPVTVGKRVAVWQTRISREDGTLVALMTQTQLILT